MATYKVLQDIEAEDKLIGPLTLRQFIYAGIGAIFLYLSYALASRGAAFMLVLFLPVSAVMGFFAFPWTRDQPTEVWALAKIRFLMKPRRRVWNQDGLKELVTITAPKTVVADYTDGLSPQEVRSRLRALAATVDTRGWAVKNANISLPLQQRQVQSSDRLVAPIAAPAKVVDDTDIRASDDMLDEKNNSDAQRMQKMIDQKTKDHRQQVIDSLKNDTPAAKKPEPNNYWFLNQPAAATSVPSDLVTFNTQVVAPGAETNKADVAPTEEATALAELEAHKAPPGVSYTGHMHTIEPLSAKHTPSPAAPTAAPATATPQTPPTPPPATPLPQLDPQAAPSTQNATPTPPQQPQPSAPQTAPTQNANVPVTPKDQTAILQLASNDDLNVATIAREAERNISSDEVVIKLH